MESNTKTLEWELEATLRDCRDWRIKFENEYRKHRETDRKLNNAEINLEYMKRERDLYKEQAMMFLEYLDEIKSEYNIGDVAHKLACEAIGKSFLDY